MAGDQRKVVAAAVQREAQITDHDLGSESAVQAGCEGYAVALLIDDADVAGITIMIALASDTVIVGPVHGREILLVLFRMPVPQLERGLFRVDELAALGGVPFGKQTLVGNLDELRVAEILV